MCDEKVGGGSGIGSSSGLVADTDEIVRKPLRNNRCLGRLHWCGVLGDKDSLFRLNKHSTITLK